MVALRDRGLREVTVDADLQVLRLVCDRRDALSRAHIQGLGRDTPSQLATSLPVTRCPSRAASSTLVCSTSRSPFAREDGRDPLASPSEAAKGAAATATIFALPRPPRPLGGCPLVGVRMVRVAVPAGRRDGSCPTER
jgi:hypothetical protein